MLGAFSPMTMRVAIGPLWDWLKRRPGGHVPLPVRIGNNGGVNLQFNAGDGWNSTGGAYPALTRTVKAGQLEP